MHLAFTMDKEPLTNTYFYATLLLYASNPTSKNPLSTFLFCLFLEFYEQCGKNSISMSLVNQGEFTTRVQFSDMQVLVILRLLSRTWQIQIVPMKSLHSGSRCSSSNTYISKRVVQALLPFRMCSKSPNARSKHLRKAAHRSGLASQRWRTRTRE